MEKQQRLDRERPNWVFPGGCILALAVLMGAYSNFFQNSFHFDDSHVVESNLYIRSLGNLPLIFSDPYTYSSNPANAGYRPLVTATLALDYWLGKGLNVRQFHITQLAMLIALGVASFFLFLRVINMAVERWWNRWAALVAATLYSVHTTNTETLNIIHVRSELLSNLAVAGSFLCYLYWPSSRRAYLYLLPMVVGAFAKSPAVVFAPLFLVYLLLFEYGLAAPDLLKARNWPRVRAAIWRSLPAFAAGLAAYLFTESMNSDTLVLGGGTRAEYLRTQVFLWFHYVRLFFVPAGLSADTDWGLIPHWYDTRVFAGLLFVALLTRILWVTSQAPALRPVAFGIAWYILALLPASSIFPLAEVSNDHRPFFAYMGLSLAVVWAAALLTEGWAARYPRLGAIMPRAVAVLAIVVIGGNVAGTYERNKVFATEETLWRDVVEKSPANGRGLMNYGLTQMAQGRYQEAKDLFDRASVFVPNYATLEVNLGIVTDRLGQPVEAEQHFNRALRLEPGLSVAHTFYARWLREQGRMNEALDHYKQAIALGPADIDARHQLLAAYDEAGRANEATKLATDTLALVPEDARSKEFLTNGTIAAPKRGEGQNPGSLLETSLRRYRAGDYQGSLDAARKALELKPDYPEAYNNIAASLASLGRWDEAIAAAREAIRLRPDYRLARNNLAWAEREKQKESQNIK
ncbi:MAG: tetratricopeptide repeat protein [Vicinamibacterales bacterium]